MQARPAEASRTGLRQTKCCASLFFVIQTMLLFFSDCPQRIGVANILRQVKLLLVAPFPFCDKLKEAI